MSDSGTDDRDGPGDDRLGEGDDPTDRDGPRDESADYDVVVVGGGPAGCSAAIFAARYGLDAVVFDRGRSSIRQCAYLENYLGFPAGVGIETFYELMHDHVTTAGCELVADLVASVSRDEETGALLVETEDDRRVSATRVVAATRYDADYLRSLGGGALFESVTDDSDDGDDDVEESGTGDDSEESGTGDDSEENGTGDDSEESGTGDDAEETGNDERGRFDRAAVKFDGTTPIDGLYVASPTDESDRQAVIAAGRGARVGLAVVRDARRDAGYVESVADHYDWMRREAARDDEWDDRDRWREYYDGHRPEETDVDDADADDADVDDARWATLRERDIDRRLEMYLSDDEIAARTERGQRRLLAHVDDDLVLERAREIEADAAEVSR
jgi:thioredoxin reductase